MLHFLVLEEISPPNLIERRRSGRAAHMTKLGWSATQLTQHPGTWGTEHWWDTLTELLMIME